MPIHDLAEPGSGDMFMSHGGRESGLPTAPTADDDLGAIPLEGSGFENEQPVQE